MLSEIALRCFSKKKTRNPVAGRYWKRSLLSACNRSSLNQFLPVIDFFSRKLLFLSLAKKFRRGQFCTIELARSLRLIKGKSLIPFVFKAFKARVPKMFQSFRRKRENCWILGQLRACWLIVFCRSYILRVASSNKIQIHICMCLAFISIVTKNKPALACFHLSASKWSIFTYFFFQNFNQWLLVLNMPIHVLIQMGRFGQTHYTVSQQKAARTFLAADALITNPNLVRNLDFQLGNF